eukprot:scaffold69377_cov69-Phaeocystis_antarctica.AAC.1
MGPHGEVARYTLHSAAPSPAPGTERLFPDQVSSDLRMVWIVKDSGWLSSKCVRDVLKSAVLSLHCVYFTLPDEMGAARLYGT